MRHPMTDDERDKDASESCAVVCICGLIAIGVCAALFSICEWGIRWLQ